MKKLSAAERCIVALDFPDYDSAMALVTRLDGVAQFYKVGLELFAGGDGARLVRELRRRELQVFVDLKLFDVPETVARATKQVVASDAQMLTVHGNDAMVAAAADAARGSALMILSVTVLTSMDDGDMRDLGFAAPIEKIAAARAARAGQLGCGGVVCSGWEVKTLRAENPQLVLVTPGVRLQPGGDDQKRTATPQNIVRDGGDYLVIGRPIKNADDPRQALTDIIRTIDRTN